MCVAGGAEQHCATPETALCQHSATLLISLWAYLNNRLNWADYADALYRKGQHRLFFIK